MSRPEPNRAARVPVRQDPAPGIRTGVAKESANTAKIRVAGDPYLDQSCGMNTHESRIPLDEVARSGWSRFGLKAWLAAIFLVLVLPVSSRGADLTDLLSGKHCPLTVKLGGLDKNWRRITLATAGTANGNISISVTVGGTTGGTSGSSQNNVADLPGSRTYLTTGQTVSANGQMYLVAYRLPGAGLDLAALIQAVATQSPPATSTLTPDSTLCLSLLDVRSIGSLEDVRPFDLNREIADSEKLGRTIAAALKAAGGASTNRPSVSPDKSGK
jgi:hypothetical protein